MAWWRYRIGPTGRLTFQAGPLGLGWAPGAPYDLVLHCASAVGRIPHAWLRQCKAPTARVLSAVRLTEPAGATGMLCVGVDEEHQPVRPRLVLDGDPVSEVRARGGVRLHGDPHGYRIYLAPGSQS